MFTRNIHQFYGPSREKLYSIEIEGIRIMEHLTVQESGLRAIYYISRVFSNVYVCEGLSLSHNKFASFLQENI